MKAQEPRMRYHDFRLKGYAVSDYGATITLFLVRDALPEIEPGMESHIEFTEVEAYHFLHTGGAILTDILEVSLEQMIGEVSTKIAEWICQVGPPSWYWKGTAPKYLSALQDLGQRAWWLYSAAGFEGFVIAKNVEQKALHELSMARGADQPRA